MMVLCEKMQNYRHYMHAFRFQPFLYKVIRLNSSNNGRNKIILQSSTCTFIQCVKFHIRKSMLYILFCIPWKISLQVLFKTLFNLISVSLASLVNLLNIILIHPINLKLDVLVHSNQHNFLYCDGIYTF